MPELPAPAMRELLAGARSGTLGTLGPRGVVHLVPVCFALDRDAVVSAVDDKPKRSRALKRLRNVDATGTATLLVDGYDEDWTQLWWIRVSGPARVVTDAGEAASAHAVLRTKYAQYATHRLGAVLVITIDEWRGWTAQTIAH